MNLSIKLNNCVLSIEADLSLAELLLSQAYTEPHFAVAVNKTFIPRSRYTDIKLQEGDVVETVSPMQGG